MKIEYLKKIMPSCDDKNKSGVVLLAEDMIKSKVFWSSSRIVAHTDCTAKRAADYLDNIIKGAKYEVEVKRARPREVKVLSIKKGIKRGTKKTTINQNVLLVALEMKRVGEPFGRRAIREYIKNMEFVRISGRWPCVHADNIYGCIRESQNIITTESFARLKITEIRQ